MVKNELPIISVTVITYNSALTIVETLNSIFSQTYDRKKIELIVCDDASKDNTTEIIERWLVDKKEEFFDVKSNFSLHNNGISQNCNIAWRLATGQWVKTIAGDDILLDTCINDNVSHIRKLNNEKIAVVFSSMIQFFTDSNGNHITRMYLPPNFQKRVLRSENHSQQYKYIKQGDIAGAPSAIIKRSALEAVDFADKEFTLIEDYPLWIKLLKAGFVFSYFDKNTVKYRQGISLTSSQLRLANENYLKQVLQANIKYREDGFLERVKCLRKIIWVKLSLLFIALVKNKKNSITNVLFKAIMFLKPYFPTYILERLSTRKRKE